MITPSLYFKAMTEVPVTYGYLLMSNNGRNKSRELITLPKANTTIELYRRVQWKQHTTRKLGKWRCSKNNKHTINASHISITEKPLEI